MPQDANNAKWKSQQERNILLGIITKGEDSFLYVYFLQTSSVPSPGFWGEEECPGRERLVPHLYHNKPEIGDDESEEENENGITPPYSFFFEQCFGKAPQPLWKKKDNKSFDKRRPSQQGHDEGPIRMPGIMEENEDIAESDGKKTGDERQTEILAKSFHHFFKIVGLGHKSDSKRHKEDPEELEDLCVCHRQWIRR